MDQITEMCSDEIEWPLSLPEQEYLDFILASYSQELDQHQQRLFSSEQASELIFRDLVSDAKSS